MTICKYLKTTTALKNTLIFLDLGISSNSKLKEKNKSQKHNYFP